jgi:hypothetical protein
MVVTWRSVRFIIVTGMRTKCILVDGCNVFSLTYGGRSPMYRAGAEVDNVRSWFTVFVGEVCIHPGYTDRESRREDY